MTVLAVALGVALTLILERAPGWWDSDDQPDSSSDIAHPDTPAPRHDPPYDPRNPHTWPVNVLIGYHSTLDDNGMLHPCYTWRVHRPYPPTLSDRDELTLRRQGGHPAIGVIASGDAPTHEDAEEAVIATLRSVDDALAEHHYRSAARDGATWTPR